MDVKKHALFLAAALILGFSACAPSEGAIQTAIAQTQTDQKKLENAVNATLTALDDQDAQATQQPWAGTLTPTFTVTVGSMTPGIVTVSVSTNTWCNKGPGSIYDKVFILYVDQTAEVIGKDQYGSYWVIKNPKNPAVTCWLWGKYATITGDASKLPVIPAPPTPTPPPGMVTAVSITVEKAVIHTPGCGSWGNQWTATITTDGPATVKFFMGNNNFPQNHTMTFTSAGTQSETDGHASMGSECGTYVITVKVTSPNVMTAQTSFTVYSQ
jgi:hypothetical protein